MLCDLTYFRGDLVLKVVVLALEPLCCHYMVVLTRKYVYRRKLLVVQWLYNGCYWLYNGKATDSLPWQPRNSEIAKNIHIYLCIHIHMHREVGRK